MMHRLIVMRHAKSAWNTAAATDHARPLNKRGRRDAPRIAAELVRLDWVPDVVLSSDSTRTRETFERMRDALGDVRVEFLDTFYGGDLNDIRSALMQLDGDARTVLVLGHNPGWEDTVSTLVDETVVMTTANAVLLSVTADNWEHAFDAEGWRIEHHLRPRQLED